MNLNNKFFTLVLAQFFYLFWGSQIYATAPTSLGGNKIQATFEDQDRGVYINLDSSGYVLEDGIWQPMETSYSKSNSTGYLTISFPFTGKIELILTFNNQSNGTFSYDYSEKDSNGVSQVLSSGEGTFITSNFNQSEIPYDKFFFDNFDSDSFSDQHWNLSTKHGISRTIQDGKLLFSGTLTDPEERWFEAGANSILSLNNDWIVETSSFATLDESYNFLAGIGIYVGFDEGSLADMSIGVGPGGNIFAECYIHGYEDEPSQYKSTPRESASEGTFRIFNSPNDKIVILQYWSLSNAQNTWKTIYEFNWETGILTEKNTYSGADVNHQFSNWSSNGNGFVAPMLDVVTPNMNHGNDQVEIFPLSEGDLGFKSFSITEGSPVSDIAPSSLNGVKITSNLTIDGVGTETRIGWIDAEGTYWDKDEDGNGQWYPAGVEYTKTGHDQAENFIGTRNNSYREGVITFDSPSSGTYTFEYWDSEGTNPLVKVADGYGDFTTEPIDNEDLPVDRYFLDNFSSSSSSEINWPIHTHNGITNHLYENAFSLSGTISDPSHQNHDVNAHSILSIQKDWVIHGTPIADLNDDGSLSFQSAVGVDFEIKDGSEEFELSIGLSEEGIFSEINTSARPGKNREMQKNSGSAYGASKFRIINSASEKKISSQYLLSGNWNTVHELNWETGEYSETDILSGQTTNSQIANWVTYQEAYGSPMMDFQLPSTRNSNGEASFLFLQSGDLGFEEFGVSEDLPLSIPPSLQNKKITITYETESGSSGTNYNYFLDDDTVKVHYLAGTEDAFWDEESYTWSESGNNRASSSITNSEGRVVTGELNFESEETGTFTLKFYEPSNGELVYQESATGTFTISDFTAEELPVSKGWMWFDHYPWVYSHVEGGWLYFMPSGSKLMVYSVKDEAWREMTE